MGCCNRIAILDLRSIDAFDPESCKSLIRQIEEAVVGGSTLMLTRDGEVIAVVKQPKSENL